MNYQPFQRLSERNRFNDARVQVTLRNAYKQRKALLDSDAMAVVGEAIFKTLSPDERRAINFTAEHGAISVSDLQRLTQKTWPASKRLLEGLKTKGILKDKRVRVLRLTRRSDTC